MNSDHAASPQELLGRVSFTYKDSGKYGEFINACRVSAWRQAVQRCGVDLRKIVDVGCACGSWFENWKAIGFSRIVGVDPNPAVIERARSLYDEVHCAYASDIANHCKEELSIGANGVVVHILEPEETVRFLRDVGRCLNQDGHFLYSVINANYYFSAGRREWVGPTSCVRTLETHREYARRAGLDIIGEFGTFIDPWAIKDLEFLASWLDRREDGQLYKPFLELGDLLRGKSIAPFSEVLMVTRLAR